MQTRYPWGVAHATENDYKSEDRLDLDNTE